MKSLLSFGVILSCLTIQVSSSADEKSDRLNQAVWQKISEAKSTGARSQLIESFYKALQNKTHSKQMMPRDESTVWAGLAMLHAKDPQARLATHAYLKKAVTVWPELNQSKQTVQIWEAVSSQFQQNQFTEEASLMLLAETLDSPQLRESKLDKFHFYRGLRYFYIGDTKSALDLFSKVSLESEHYRRVKFFEGVLYFQAKNLEEAKRSFQMVVALEETSAERQAVFESGSIERLKELSVLNTARILYEQGQFQESVSLYRTLRQGSQVFFESLHEQAWAFFMAGYPNRALGAVYAANTPFFKNRFEPELHLINSVVHYWLCHFDTSLSHLRRFAAVTKGEGEKLRQYVERNNSFKGNEGLLRYAELYENISKGVSHTNTPVGIKTYTWLKSNLPSQNAMNAIRSSAEARLKMAAQLKGKIGRDFLLDGLQEYEKLLKIELGRVVQGQIVTLNNDWQKTYMQGRLLYLEILTAQKDVLMGQERSVKGTEFQGEEKDFADIGENQVWNQDKREFWYDELGSYVFHLKSQCGTEPEKENVSKR